MENFKFFTGKKTDQLFSIARNEYVEIKYLTYSELRSYYKFFNKVLLTYGKDSKYQDKYVKYWLDKIAYELVLDYTRNNLNF